MSKDRRNRLASNPETLGLLLSVLAVYVLVGMAFGVFFVNTLNLPAYYSGIFGAVVLTGAGQFLSVQMLATGANIVEILVAVTFINFRHVFYGMSLRNDLKYIKWRAYVISFMTDEIFSLFKLTPNKAFWPQIAFCCHSAWVVGCLAGAYLSESFSMNIKGLGFIMINIFVVASLELGNRKNLNYIVSSTLVYIALFASGVQDAFLFTMVGLAVFLFAKENFGEARS